MITRQSAADGILGDIPLTIDDYALGIFDLSGELMRFAITAIATTGSLPASKANNLPTSRSLLTDLRQLRTCFEALDTTSCSNSALAKDFAKKMEVMVQSVEKVENAVCSLIIRGQERPKGWVPDVASERGALESY